VSRREEPVTIDIVKLIVITDLAVLVRIEEDKEGEDCWDEWIPLSLIEDQEAVEEDMRRPVNRRKLTSIEIQRWKAEELGLE